MGKKARTPERALMLQLRRAGQNERVSGRFSPSKTTMVLHDEPVNRKGARAYLKQERVWKAKGNQPEDRLGNAKAEGILKIQQFHKRAGLLLIPYSEEELQTYLIKAKTEFDKTGELSAATLVNLNNAHVDVAKTTHVWQLMLDSEVDMTGETVTHPDYKPEDND